MSSRQKSCIACAGAKRRCYPQLPRCPRCMRRGIQCSYKNEPLRASSIPPSSDPDSRELRVQRETGTLDWPVYAPSATQVDKRDIESSLSIALESPGPTALQANRLANQEWDTGNQFAELLNVTWVQESIPARMPRSTVEIDPWAIRCMIHNFTKWPTQFVYNLELPFIHYSYQASPSIPQPIQEAFAACAGYVARSERNKSLVLSIIEQKMGQLLQQQPLFIFMSLETFLATLQAILLLHLIQLWDGDVRQRALAQMNIEDINIWALQLHYRTMETPSPSSWEQWITMESARRTVLMAFVTHGVFEASKHGGCGYTSTLSDLPLTILEDAWAARSPNDWKQQHLELEAPRSRVSTYAAFTAAWRQAGGGAAGSFGKLLLTPCVGPAYRSLLASQP